jgi:FimV-like protein
MISLILKCYLSILLSVGIVSLLIFILGLYLIFRKSSPKQTRQTNPRAAESLQDLSAIAGEDVITTQLDLARAYIETGHMQSAKDILDYVIKQGNTTQQQEAQQLLNGI